MSTLRSTCQADGSVCLLNDTANKCMSSCSKARSVDNGRQHWEEGKGTLKSPEVPQCHQGAWAGASCWETFFFSMWSESVPGLCEGMSLAPTEVTPPPIWGLRFPANTQLECHRNHVTLFFSSSTQIHFSTLGNFVHPSAYFPDYTLLGALSVRASQEQPLKPQRNPTLWGPPVPSHNCTGISMDISLLFPGPQLHCLIWLNLHELLMTHM